MLLSDANDDLLLALIVGVFGFEYSTSSVSILYITNVFTSSTFDLIECRVRWPMAAALSSGYVAVALAAIVS